MEHNFDRTPLFLWCLCWSPVLTCVDFGCISAPPENPGGGGQQQPRRQLDGRNHARCCNSNRKSRSNILKSLFMKPKTVNADKYFFDIQIELVDGWLRFIVERLRRWGLGEHVPPLQMPHPVGLVIWIQQDFKINTYTIYTLYVLV